MPMQNSQTTQQLMDQLKNSDAGSSSGTPIQDSAVVEQNSTSVILEDREQIIAPGRPMQTQDNSFANSASMPETQWMVKNLVEKEYIVNQFQWTTAHTRTQRLTSTPLPSSIFAKTHFPFSNIMKSFAYLRLGISMSVKVNSTTFHQGLLLVSWAPMKYGNLNDYYSMYNKVLRPCGYNNAAESNTVTIDIPFVHLFNYIDRLDTGSDFFDLGELEVHVYNPLQCPPTATTSIEVTITVNGLKPEVHGMIPTLQGLEDVVGSIVNAGKSALQTYQAIENGDIAGAIQSGTETISNVECVVQNLDAPLSNAAHDPHKNQLHHQGNGPWTGIRMSLNRVGTTKHPVSLKQHKFDEMDIKKLIQIYSGMGYFSWASDQPTATDLFYTFVHPNVANYASLVTVGAKDYYRFSHTALGGLVHRHTAWRGSIEYKFQCISNEHQKGRLLFYWIPAWKTGIPTMEEAQSAYYWMVDIQKSREWEITVPFLSPTTWRSMPTGPQYYTFANKESVNISFLEYNGIFGCKVLNPFTINGVVQNNCEINMYIRAGPDFEVQGLRAPFGYAETRANYPTIDSVSSSPVPAAPTTSNSFAILQGNETLSDTQSTIQNWMPKGQPNSPLPTSSEGTIAPMHEFFMDEKPMHLKVLMRKFTPFYQFHNEAPVTTDEYKVLSFYIPVSPFLGSGTYFKDYPTIDIFDIYPMNTLEYYSRAFIWWRGSMRYEFNMNNSYLSFFNTTACFVPSASEVPGMTTRWSFVNADTQISPMLPMLDYSFQSINPGQTSYSIEVPYCSIYNQLMTTPEVGTNLNPNPYTNGVFNIHMQFNSHASVDTRVNILCTCLAAAGDDFQVSWFIGWPIFYIPRTMFPNWPQS